MWPALDSTGHRVPRTKPTCLLHTWRPHRRRPFALVLHLHQHQSSRNLHLQYLAKSQSTQRCQSLITQGSDHPPVLEPHIVLSGTSLMTDDDDIPLLPVQNPHICIWEEGCRRYGQIPKRSSTTVVPRVASVMSSTSGRVASAPPWSTPSAG
jgi:hypothetical protein